MINNDRPPRRLKPQVQMSVDGYIAAAAYQNNLLQNEMAARKKIFV